MTDVQSPRPASAARPSEEIYRQMWKWDRVAWVSHCVDCYPGSCPYHAYVRDGRVLFEEVSGTHPDLVPGVPDRNPMGCQKGAAWSHTLYGQERVLYPLKRAGERGQGRWQRVSWEQALAEIADGMLDAIQEVGPESLIWEMTPAEGGTMAIWPSMRFLVGLMGGLCTDVNAVINDFQPGHYITWGKFNPVSTPESRWQTEFRLIWHSNPAYTTIPNYHFGPETRYHGCEVVMLAPDCGPSHIHSDCYFPVRIGTDGALALAMCQVIIQEGLHNAGFVKEQTDLPLLVRLDNRHFLRASDLDENGRDDQFYFLDSRTGGLAEAPRGTLALGNVDPALEGRLEVVLADGRRVEVTPVFAVLREMLDRDYTPEKAYAVCEVHPDNIRMMARKVAGKRTAIGMGMNLCKYYHGDLIQRAMLLLLGLTANWGRHGSGIGSWSPGSFEGPAIFGMKQRLGVEETMRVLSQRHAGWADALKAEDPTLTDEMVAIELLCRGIAQGVGNFIPPAFFWYYHCGYRHNWNERQWGDATMRRSFDEYLSEAVEKGWWQGVARPGPETPPRVLFEVGGNMLRRQRGGQNQLLRHLWPQLKLMVSIDWRMSTTGMFSDFILPAAQHYEKLNFHLASPSLLQLTFSDRAVEPQGEAKAEWDIFRLLAKKVEERAAARNLVEYNDSLGRTWSLKDLHYRFTLGVENEDQLVAEWMQDTALAGTLAPGESLESMREKGFAMFTHVGDSVFTLNQATDVTPGEPFTSLRLHVEDKVPYPTLTRRAQFYIDHEWFLEAGEELPIHKETPAMGGDYPFQMTSGHNRWSIHSMNIANRTLLQTHRGRPHLVMNASDAASRGIRDLDEVRVFNDMGSFLVPVKVAPWVRPGQVIIYNGWDPYQFRGWKGPMDVEPGMVKWLGLAGGYGHLRYWPIQWQPVPIDRAVRVDVAKA